MAWTDNPGHGTKLQKKITSVYTDIPGEVELDGPSLQMLVRETTNLTSALVQRKPTIPDPGEVNLQIQFDPAEATHTSLYTDLGAGTSEDWKLLFNTSGANYCTFFGFVTSYKIGGMTWDGTLIADVTVQLTSMPIFGP